MPIKGTGTIPGQTFRQDNKWLVIPSKFGKRKFKWDWSSISQDGSFAWLHIRGAPGIEEFQAVQLIDGVPSIQAFHLLNPLDSNSVMVLNINPSDPRGLPKNFDDDIKRESEKMSGLIRAIESQEIRAMTALDQEKHSKQAQAELADNVAKILPATRSGDKR